MEIIETPPEYTVMYRCGMSTTETISTSLEGDDLVAFAEGCAPSDPNAQGWDAEGNSEVCEIADAETDEVVWRESAAPPTPDLYAVVSPGDTLVVGVDTNRRAHTATMAGQIARNLPEGVRLVLLADPTFLDSVSPADAKALTEVLESQVRQAVKDPAALTLDRVGETREEWVTRAVLAALAPILAGRKGGSA